MAHRVFDSDMVLELSEAEVTKWFENFKAKESGTFTFEFKTLALYTPEPVVEAADSYLARYYPSLYGPDRTVMDCKYDCYFRAALDSSPRELAKTAKRILADVDYDTMIGTGLSGALVVPELARALKKHWAIVRKPGESVHAFTLVVGEVGKRWLFVDDFIASGATMRRVQDAVADEAKAQCFQTEQVGTYLYEDSKFQSARPRKAGKR